MVDFKKAMNRRKDDEESHTRPGLRRSALFYENNDGRYRQILTREWGTCQRTAIVIGVNPSVADAEFDDATIRTLYGFCDTWGRERLIMLNLFGYIATDQADLFKATDPEGPLNFPTFHEIFGPEDRDFRQTEVIAAWGNGGTYRDQDMAMMEWLHHWGVVPLCLGTNDNGTPKHPLRIAHDTPLQPYLIQGIGSGD